MSKAITSGQARNMIASFANDTPWEEIDTDLQPFIELPPKERGERFAHFLKYGCVAKKPSEYNISHTPFEPASVPPLDYIIHVDRSVRPSYPNWVKSELINTPEFITLEATGPADYDLSNAEQWFHVRQREGLVTTGHDIYGSLKDANALADCYGLADLLALQKKDLAVFRALFKGKAVFGWKSVVQDLNGNLFVPCLIKGIDEAIVHWCYFGSRWDSLDSALCFSK